MKTSRGTAETECWYWWEVVYLWPRRWLWCVMEDGDLLRLKENFDISIRQHSWVMWRKNQTQKPGYEKNISVYQKVKLLELPLEGNHTVLEWSWCIYERNYINRILWLAVNWSYWSKDHLKDVFVSAIVRTQFTQIRHLKEVSVLNLHCSTTWGKSMILIKHTPKFYSTTLE